MTALLRAALAGAATGGRGFTGLAALALATPPKPITQPDRTLSIGWVKIVAALLAAGEIVGDKLPQAPSRLEPIGLGAHHSVHRRRDGGRGRHVLARGAVARLGGRALRLRLRGGRA